MAIKALPNIREIITKDLKEKILNEESNKIKFYEISKEKSSSELKTQKLLGASTTNINKQKLNYFLKGVESKVKRELKQENIILLNDV